MDDTEAYFEAFEGLCAKDLVSRTLECVDKCLDAASMAVSDIDQIFLVGGSSAVPEVVGQVKGKFDKEPYKSKISPALSISQGAAYYCNMIMLPSSKGPKVLDQTVHPLGLEIAGRRFLEVIPKGIAIPEEGLELEAEELLYTNFDDLTSLAIVVYEDTRPDNLPKHLKFIYEKGMKRLSGTTLKGIPADKKKVNKK